MTYKNILIVRTDRLGDVVLTTPSIKALREAFPQARLSILVSPATYDLVDGNGLLDEVLIDDRRHEHKGPWGFIRLVRVIRARKFDLAVIFHTKKRTNVLCFLAGIPVRLGYKNNKFGFLLNKSVEDTRHLGERHEAQYCLDLLKDLGIAGKELSLYIPIAKEALSWAERFCHTHNIGRRDSMIAIHCGASDPAKRWPAEHFARVIDALVERYAAKIILIGSPDDCLTSRQVVSISKNQIIDITGQTAIAQLAALLTQCRLLVSNDSGPVHIAAGVGTPVVSIFTRNAPGINPERWRPLGDRTRVVSVQPFQSEGMSFQKARPMEKQYRELISTDAVLEAVDSLLKLC